MVRSGTDKTPNLAGDQAAKDPAGLAIGPAMGSGVAAGVAAGRVRRW